MKIVIDSAIPFVGGVFEPFCEVEYLEGGLINHNTVKDASALLIRTRTRCNKELLEGSSVRHIATATIGFDHIDTHYCAQQGIAVSTAAGCNARAVLQWVGAVLATLSQREGWHPQSKTLGVVGVGNVGSLISHYARLWGFKVICCDPPRYLREGGDFVSFEQLATQADIITLHTPLNQTTRHLINAESLQLASHNSFIINSSRGEVVDTSALLQSKHPFAMDVWEQEPRINVQALDAALFATPHIAGYSLQGKANASRMAVGQIASALNIPLTDWHPSVEQVNAKDIGWEELKESITQYFDIEAQSNHLKGNRELFEEIRNNYKYREEYF